MIPRVYWSFAFRWSWLLALLFAAGAYLGAILHDANGSYRSQSVIIVEFPPEAEGSSILDAVTGLAARRVAAATWARQVTAYWTLRELSWALADEGLYISPNRLNRALSARGPSLTDPTALPTITISAAAASPRNAQTLARIAARTFVDIVERRNEETAQQAHDANALAASTLTVEHQEAVEAKSAALEAAVRAQATEDVDPTDDADYQAALLREATLRDQFAELLRTQATLDDPSTIGSQLRVLEPASEPVGFEPEVPVDPGTEGPVDSEPDGRVISQSVIEVQYSILEDGSMDRGFDGRRDQAAILAQQVTGYWTLREIAFYLAYEEIWLTPDELGSMLTVSGPTFEAGLVDLPVIAISAVHQDGEKAQIIARTSAQVFVDITDRENEETVERLQAANLRKVNEREASYQRAVEERQRALEAATPDAPLIVPDPMETAAYQAAVVREEVLKARLNEVLRALTLPVGLPGVGSGQLVILEAATDPVTRPFLGFPKRFAMMFGGMLGFGGAWVIGNLGDYLRYVRAERRRKQQAEVPDEEAEQVFGQPLVDAGRPGTHPTGGNDGNGVHATGPLSPSGQAAT